MSTDEFVSRIWARDDTLWAPGDDVPSDRLGWLSLPEDMRPYVSELTGFRDRAVDDGFSTVGVVGMGGSSLAPEFFGSLLHRHGYPDLVVFDSTHPDQIRALTTSVDMSATLFLISSKSGGTAETLSLYRFLRSQVDDGGHFVAITDPGSGLATLAGREGFLATFLNPPDIGGRYSALSLFGLVPAALVGADLDALLDSAEAAATEARTDASTAVELGLRLGESVRSGADKLTLATASNLALLGDWLEQLLAESTGKNGTGVVPIIGEPDVDTYGSDRLHVSVGWETDTPHQPGIGTIRRQLGSSADLGGEMYTWEFATVVAGTALGINPFDQPDVEAAKEASRAALTSVGDIHFPSDDPSEFFSGMAPPEYAAILAFAPADGSHREVVQAARARLSRSYGVATVGAFGPRYLHSSGQLYKGGPKTLRALVVLDPPSADLEIPGESHGFSRLITAQAAGDVEAMRQAGQQVAATSWERFSDWALG